MARQRAISQEDFLIAMITVSSPTYKLSLSPLLRQLSNAVRLMVRTYSYCIALTCACSYFYPRGSYLAMSGLECSPKNCLKII